MSEEENINLTQFLNSSKRGKPKLIYDGYEFNQKQTHENTIYWRCIDRKCRGHIRTTLH